MTGRGRVELREDAVLELQLLRHRLDREVDVTEPLVAGHRCDQADDLLDLGGGRLVGELALGDELGRRLLAQLARLGDPGVDERLVGVLEQDGKAGGRDRLGDFDARGARADDRRFEHEHAAETSG